MKESTPLVTVRPSRYVRRMADAMVVIREYISEVEAMIARSVLEAHDIPALVLRDDAGGMLPSMHLVFPIRLAVRRTEATLALHILDTPFRASTSLDDPLGDADRPGRP